MEAKKNPRADLHQQRHKFFLIGLVTSISMLIMAFEWKTEKRDTMVRRFDHTMEILPIIPSTEIETPKLPKQIAPPLINKATSVITLSPTDFSESPDDIETKIPEFKFDDPLAGTPTYTETEVDTTATFVFVEKQPEPVGGLKAFYETISRKIKYPNQARRQGAEGKVTIEFVVNRKGAIADMKVIGGIGAGCDEEAMRVIALSKWEAGKQRGKPVNVRISMPIYFRLSQ
jgi:protein TonB